MSFAPTNVSGTKSRRSLPFAWWLNAWYLLLFTTVVGGVAFLSRVAVENSVEAAARAEIRDKLDTYLAVYEGRGVEALRQRVLQDISRGTPVAVNLRGGFGRSRFLILPSPEIELDLAAVELVSEDEDRQWLRVPGSDGQTWRIGAAQLSAGATLQVLMSDARGLDVIDSYDRQLLPLVFFALVFGVAGGLWLTRRVRDPIVQLAATTQRVLTSGQLDARVPERGSADELDELVSLYNRMLERNERLVEGMREALDNVAHDLRTPLARLRMSAEHGLGQQDVGAAQEALADCLEESERVLATLKALMDVSEAETGVMKLERQKTDLQVILRQVCELYEHVADERGITVEQHLPDDPLWLSADASRLTPAFANLLDNALKYTPPGGRVVIEAGSTATGVVVEVRDTGPGIAEHERRRVFERLYRGDKSRSTRGLGLGLSFVKAIVEAHGGDVGIETAGEGGASFRVRLPLGLPKKAGMDV